MTATAWPERRHDDNPIPGDPVPWMNNTPCRDKPGLFFSEEQGDIAAAKTICVEQCPLASRLSCMDYALDNNLEYGVWGGTSREERVEKQCISCEQWKTLEDFPPRRNTLDGHNPTCSSCASGFGRQIAAKRSPEHASLKSLKDAREKQATAADQRALAYARLVEQHGRKEAIRILRITRRTAQRYAMRLQELEVAA